MNPTDRPTGSRSNAPSSRLRSPLGRGGSRTRQGVVTLEIGLGRQEEGIFCVS